MATKLTTQALIRRRWTTLDLFQTVDSLYTANNRTVRDDVECARDAKDMLSIAESEMKGSEALHIYSLFTVSSL